MRTRIGAVACVVTALFAAGCGAGSGRVYTMPDPPLPTTVGPTQEAPPKPPQPTGVSLPPGATTTPAGPPAIATPRRSDCVSGTELATVRARETPAPVCLLVGATLEVTGAPSPDQPWESLSTSDRMTLPCTSTVNADGSVSGECRAVAPGTATVRTRAPATDDAPAMIWELTVQIVS